MKRNIILFSVLATLAISACGGKKTAEDNKQAKLDALKKEIAKLQSEASALEKEIDQKSGKINGKAVEITEIKKGVFQSYIMIEGSADANESTIATPKVPGTIVRVLVQPGASVTQVKYWPNSIIPPFLKVATNCSNK